MSDDPRAFFRLPPRNCSMCEHWPAHLAELGLAVETRSGTVELPCAVFRPKQPVTPAISYENGWRRGSDSCPSWTRRTP